MRHCFAVGDQFIWNDCSEVIRHVVAYDKDGVYDERGAYYDAKNIRKITGAVKTLNKGDTFVRTADDRNRTTTGKIGYSGVVCRIAKEGFYDGEGAFHLFSNVEKVLTLDDQIAETEKKLEELRAAKERAERPEIKVGQLWEDSQERGSYRVLAIVEELEASVVFFYKSHNNPSTNKVASWLPSSVHKNLKLVKFDPKC